MRRMYQECKLIHADLSEYNILYHNKQVWFIDVSQSVEYDHPNSMEFLRKDCTCISNFFSRNGVDNCISPRQIFNFVTNPNLNDSKLDEYLEELHQQNEEEEEISNEDLISEGVFQRSFIPRTLGQVRNPTSELFENQESFHKSVTGLSKN